MIRQKSYGLLFVLLILLSGSGYVYGQDKPNIIFFIGDDVDKYQLGCFGGPVYTPNIDSLAAQGAVFHHAYVNSTVCTPSRYSLTTGRFAGRSAFSDYLDEYPVGSQGHPEFNVGLEQDLMNVGHVLQSQGYETGWIGKFHLGEDKTLDALSSTENSFLKTASPDDPLATELFQKEEQAFKDYIVNKGFSWAENIYEGNLENPFKAHNLEWTLEPVMNYLDSVGDKPFYLHINTTLLHGPDGEWERSLGYPLYTGEGLVSTAPQAGMPPRSTINERILANGHNLNDNPSGITWLDDGIGAIMKKLDSLGISENTMLVFLPDHGSENKASLFNLHGTNIPMIIRYPAEIAAGTQCHSLVQALDMIPTFFELAGADLPPAYKLDGQSIRPLFSDPGTRIHESLFFELGCARAVMTEEYKYIAVRYPQDRTDAILNINEEDLKDKIVRKIIYLNGHVGISSRGIRYNPDYLSPDQLYKLSEDPGELNNLAEDPDYKEILADMKVHLKGYLEEFEGRPFGEFIPGPNASTPHPEVLRYIRNIQSALQNGASIQDGKIICEGNCVSSPVVSSVEQLSKTSSLIRSIIQDETHCILNLDEQVENLKMYDLSGKMILSRNRTLSKFEIDTQEFPTGLYIIQLTGDGRMQAEKILLK